jgi:hypothetical protein
VKAQINVTSSLLTKLLRCFRVFGFAATAIGKTIEQESQTQKAKRRFLERMRNAPDRGTQGKIQWTRDELHER